ncbi:MAG: hypothetical protein VKL59_03960 [Nostocaceae cyanobacterium]|nr:hypothetical protein [Nostocaceae cyanobacterium]
MKQYTDKSLQILAITGLKPQNFADLIRTAQIIFDPAVGLSGRDIKVNWQDFDVPAAVVENLKLLGQRYRYASPYLPIDIIWEQLIPETRSWFIDHQNLLWRFEESFPALDED